MVSLTIASVGDITKAQKTDERPLKTGLGPHVGIRREFDLTATEQNPGGHFGPVRQNSLRMIVTKVRPRRVT